MRMIKAHDLHTAFTPATNDSDSHRMYAVVWRLGKGACGWGFDDRSAGLAEGSLGQGTYPKIALLFRINSDYVIHSSVSEHFKRLNNVPSLYFDLSLSYYSGWKHLPKYQRQPQFTEPPKWKKDGET